MVHGPARVLAHLPAGRQLLRQRCGPTERHGRVYARLRVPVQGYPAVRLPVAAAHRLRAVRTPGRHYLHRRPGRRRRRRPDHRKTDDGEFFAVKVPISGELNKF